MPHPVLIAGAVLVGATGVGVGTYYVVKQRTGHPVVVTSSRPTSSTSSTTPSSGKPKSKPAKRSTTPKPTHASSPPPTPPTVAGYTAHRSGARVVYVPIPPRRWSSAWGPLPDYAHLSAGTCAWHWMASHPPLVWDQGHLGPLAGYVALASYTPRTGTLRQVVLRRGQWPSYGFVADCRDPSAIVKPPVIMGR